MSEANFWRYVSIGMALRWDAQRHEDQSAYGVPDVSFGIDAGAQGWIELKADSLPKRATTVVALKHFTPWQRRWLKRRGKTGASCWLLVRLDRTYMLFHWSRIDPIGSLTLDGLKKIATATWEMRIDFNQLYNHLRRATP